MRNASAFCRNEKLVDPSSGEHSDPDEKLMRSIEEIAGVPINSKREFRNGLFVHKAAALERGEEFTFKTFLVLKDAIEKKLLNTLKNVVSLTLTDPIKALDDKTKKRKNDVLENLIERGYCEHCAEALINFVSRMLRKME
jgi:serine protein kinase